MSFNKYYDHYLSLHQNKNCRRLHLLGMAVGICVFVLLFCSPWWWLSVVAPLTIYPFAWVGHIAFEKNIPATWSNPLLAGLSDLFMTWDICRGRIEF